MKKLIFFFTAMFSLCRALGAEIDASQLLPPEQAFVPRVEVSKDGAALSFDIADGYYLYQSKIEAATDPEGLLGKAEFSPGEQKEDEFFGKQTVYHRSAAVTLPYTKQPDGSYTLTVAYQGCAEVGVCYPPSETSFDIKGNGMYRIRPADSASDRFTAPKAATIQEADNQSPPAVKKPADSSRFKLSWDTLNANLLAFFVAGLALSFTACMYPLIPIVSSIVVGDKNAGKGRAFMLTLVYMQGLALTYTLVGVVAGMTGALLTVWLQQPAVVLSAAALMVVLALSMFGLFNIQLPNALQSYFQNQSNKLSGGKIAGVFGMGMLSALIVGPCVAPPLAAALGYIGKTGDALLGGMALYALALGTGVPLMVIGTFGGHVLPKAGGWMNGVKYAFGFILLAVAVYLARPFIPYAAAAALYTLLLVLPALLLLSALGRQKGGVKAVSAVLAAVLLVSGAWFGLQSVRGEATSLHGFLTLHPPAAVGGHKKFADVAQLKEQMQKAWQADPDTPVIVDFYADWCVSCKEMEAYTLNQPEVLAAVPMDRFFQIDVTANTPEHRALLKEYGLFGPPGVFAVRSDGSRSEALLGFVKPPEFIEWYRQNAK
ncbi:MAG: protein-disulfide reductase DsbD [Neisseria sp.]|nr:protein-disulfide reductase DsbD [Neisseria sp.]